MSRTEWRMMLRAEYEAWVRAQARQRRRPVPACEHDPRAHDRRATPPDPF